MNVCKVRKVFFYGVRKSSYIFVSHTKCKDRESFCKFTFFLQLPNNFLTLSHTLSDALIILVSLTEKRHTQKLCRKNWLRKREREREIIKFCYCSKKFSKDPKFFFVLSKEFKWKFHKLNWERECFISNQKQLSYLLIQCFDFSLSLSLSPSCRLSIDTSLPPSKTPSSFNSPSHSLHLSSN